MTDNEMMGIFLKHNVAQLARIVSPVTMLDETEVALPAGSLRRTRLAAAAMTWCIRSEVEDNGSSLIGPRQAWRVLTTTADDPNALSAELALSVVHDEAYRQFLLSRSRPHERYGVILERRSEPAELAFRIAHRITAPQKKALVTLHELCTGYRLLLDDYRGVMLNGLLDVFYPELAPDPLGDMTMSGMDGTEKELAFDVYQSMDPENGQLDQRLIGVLHDYLEEHPRRCPAVILEHLREPGPHYRGCWVLDHFLEKQ